MPVKNKNRQTNSGYEGVITGLNDEEKKVLEDAGIGGGEKPILDLSPYYNSDTEIVSQEGMSLLINKILNNEIVGINLGGEFICMLLDGAYGATIEFLSRALDGEGGRVKVSIATEDGKVSQKDEYASLTLLSTSPSSQVIPSITTTNTQQNLTIGNGLTIENGVLKTSEKTLTISITDILTDNSKIQELFSKMTSTTEQSALILFDNPINYDTYKDYDTIKLDLSPLSSMGVSGYYILRNQSHLNGYTPVYSLTTMGMEYSGSNLNKLVVKNLFITGNDEVNTPLNKFLLKIL